MNNNIKFVSLEQVMTIHEYQIELFGGSHGIRDLGLLKSAIETPASGLGNTYFHNGIFEMASAYMFHIIKNHPFVDGNKRTGTATALTFLRANGIGHFPLTDEFTIDLAIQVATSELSKEDLANIFRNFLAS
jgi:death-on-curing protein